MCLACGNIEPGMVLSSKLGRLLLHMFNQILISVFLRIYFSFKMYQPLFYLIYLSSIDLSLRLFFSSELLLREINFAVCMKCVQLYTLLLYKALLNA